MHASVCVRGVVQVSGFYLSEGRCTHLDKCRSSALAVNHIMFLQSTCAYVSEGDKERCGECLGARMWEYFTVLSKAEVNKLSNGRSPF